jgi:TnpA family transposase
LFWRKAIAVYQSQALPKLCRKPTIRVWSEPHPSRNVATKARLDPRRRTPSMGLYSHVRDRWGIFHAQPLILNDQRQAGAAIEGVIRHEELDITQLAVDTHGHTDFAMALAKLLGFDLCPRLKALKDRHLFLPRGMAIPASVQEICRASVDLERIRSHWEQIVHLVASVHSGHTSAVNVTARFGSASRGDPLYEAIVHLGRLLRTVFLCDYFLNDVFRRELLRVLNRGEAINALKRAIYTGRIAGGAGEIYPPTTVCYCTKNERTPKRPTSEESFPGDQPMIVAFSAAGHFFDEDLRAARLAFLGSVG